LLGSCDSSNQNKYSFPLTKTRQTICFDNEGNILTDLQSGDDYYGQDGDYQKGQAMSYTDNGDGTVTDNVTGLVWGQNQSDSGMTWDEAQKYCENLTLGGYDDWRLPSLKELWSIRDFSTGWPYVDTVYFHFAGDGSQGRSQYTWSSNPYVVNTDEAVKNTVFATNDWTGHIKCFEGDRYVRPVRGDVYGENNFKNNENNTVTDISTGLMWAKDDSKMQMSWKDALKYADTCTLAGYDDWRVPNVKELQSIVDYSGVFPAIDTLFFNISSFKHSDGVLDYPFFWTSTSAFFGQNSPKYKSAWYVAFGYGVGRSGKDLHGAGSVRFISKNENAEQEEEGGQHDMGQNRHDDGAPEGVHQGGKRPQGPPSDGVQPQGNRPDSTQRKETRPDRTQHKGNHQDRTQHKGTRPHDRISAEERESSYVVSDSTSVPGINERYYVRLVRDVE
jgi:hypothetical protein